jgi:prepilin-type N-terminal cleavage/methylation domain-containing protein
MRDKSEIRISKFEKNRNTKYPACRQAGFTLIELLIAITIIILLSIGLVPNIKGQRLRQNMIESSSQLQIDLRTAQNHALSGYVCNNTSAAGQQIRAYYWFIRFADENGYTLGPKCRPSYSDDTSPDISTLAIDPSPWPAIWPQSFTNTQQYNVKVDAIEFGRVNNNTFQSNCSLSGVGIRSISIRFANITGKAVFVVPNGTSCTGVASNPNTTAVRVVLRSTIDPSFPTKKIVVEKGGGIYIE